MSGKGIPGHVDGNVACPPESRDALAVGSRKRVDFFVSYTSADRPWAEWIAWVLEAADYTVLVQAWDFGAGANFVLEMHRAARISNRTVASQVGCSGVTE